jgi:drug/metabolite transporter (DMT)-like permease
MIRFAQREADSLVISAARLSIAVLILIPIAITRYPRELRQMRGTDLWLSMLSGGFLAAHFAAWISSLQFTSVASSVVLVATTPLWVALFSPLFLKESLTIPIKIGLVIALLGGGIVGFSDACQITAIGIHCDGFSSFFQGKAFFGNILAIAGAVTAAGYLLVGRKVSGRHPLVVYILSVYGSAAILLILVVWVLGIQWSGFSTTTYAFLIGLALIPQLLGHSSYNWALKYLPAAYVSIVLLAEPIGSTILAYFLLNEPPTSLELIGGGVILCGIYIASQSSSSAS